MTVPLLIAMVSLPELLLLTARLLPDPGAWPLLIPMILLLGLVAVLFRVVYRNNRDGLTVLACAYAAGWSGAVQTVYGVWTVTTGRTFSRYFSYAVPRSASIENFILAATLWIVAGGLLAWHARRSPLSDMPNAD